MVKAEKAKRGSIRESNSKKPRGTIEEIEALISENCD
jgi:hypothetical protein